MRYLTAWCGFWVIFWVHLIVGIWLIFKRMERGERDEREYMRLVRLTLAIRSVERVDHSAVPNTRA